MKFPRLSKDQQASALVIISGAALVGIAGGVLALAGLLLCIFGVYTLQRKKGAAA